MHTREQIMYQKDIHIKRKKHILTHIWHNDYIWWGYDGKLSKGKIHCSCPYCTEKTSTKSMRRYSTYHKAGMRLNKNWPIRDIRHMKEELE